MSKLGGARTAAKLIVGNWKMYTDSAGAGQLATAIADGVRNEQTVSVALCPPFPYLALVRDLLVNCSVALGAQNLFPETEGAFTGEISPTMLLDVGCKYVIIGHSERRRLGESDEFIHRKVKVALNAGLQVIFCVGETLDQRKSDQTEAVITNQVSRGLFGIQSDLLMGLKIAYEPVWAIGSSGRCATLSQVEAAHGFVRRCFSLIFGEGPARALRLLYGGNVNPENATELLGCHDVDGVLVGAASLKAEQFLRIVESAIAVRCLPRQNLIAL